MQLCLRKMSNWVQTLLVCSVDLNTQHTNFGNIFKGSRETVQGKFLPVEHRSYNKVFKIISTILIPQPPNPPPHPHPPQPP